MEPNVGIGHSETPQPSFPAVPDYTPAPAPIAVGCPVEPGTAAQQPAPGAGSAVPWLLLVRLGFVAVMLIVAVVLIALGYTAAAAVGLILGVGLAAVEIIKRLG
jgi:hypothetical protein